MSTTLLIESFSELNLRERTQLDIAAITGATELTVLSSDGYSDGDIIYLGPLSRDGCERAVIASVQDETTIQLTAPLALDHPRFEPVTSVLGDLIRIYRAPNVDGSVPATDNFAVLATRTIKADALSTYYTDADGNSSYWYRHTYYNATTGDETDLEDSIAVRGDDFGHYASISEIRAEAGFSNNFNLKDAFVDQQRRAAEAEINAALANAYTTPFTPVPDLIHVLTVQLAAGLLMQAEYGTGSSKGKDKLNDARAQLKSLQSQDSTITDGEGTDLAAGRVSFWPDETAPRAFFIGDKF